MAHAFRPLNINAAGVIAFIVAFFFVNIAVAQSQSIGSEIAILNQDILFSQSLFGIRVKATLDENSSALAAQNRSKEADLQAEELALTEQRPTLDPDEFRLLADAFDEKVELIRSTQSQKEADLQNWSAAERQRFFVDALPVLQSLTLEIGASVVLDSRTVVLATGSVDITQLAISRLNDAFGDGNIADQ